MHNSPVWIHKLLSKEIQVTPGKRNYNQKIRIRTIKMFLNPKALYQKLFSKYKLPIQKWCNQITSFSVKCYILYI